MKERTKAYTFQPKLYKSKVNPKEGVNYQVYQKGRNKVLDDEEDNFQRRPSAPPYGSGSTNAPVKRTTQATYVDGGDGLMVPEDQYFDLQMGATDMYEQLPATSRNDSRQKQYWSTTVGAVTVSKRKRQNELDNKFEKSMEQVAGHIGPESSWGRAINYEAVAPRGSNAISSKQDTSEPMVYAMPQFSDKYEQSAMMMEGSATKSQRKTKRDRMQRKTNQF